MQENVSRYGMYIYKICSMCEQSVILNVDVTS